MDLYQELILDHSKHPQHAGLREPFGAESHHVNTSCGDEITLRVDVEGEGDDAVIRDVSYDSIGCSISVASASMLADNLVGHTLREAQEVFGATRSMLTSKGKDAGDEEVIGDAIALAGVSQYPARVKCALLSWSALQDSLGKLGLDLAGSAANSTTSGTTASSDKEITA